LLQLRAKRFVLNGEIVIIGDGQLSFDDLLMRRIAPVIRLYYPSPKLGLHLDAAMKQDVIL
jgi:hypothetical protein